MNTLNRRPLMNALNARTSFTSELDPGALIDADLFGAFAAGEFPAARFVHVERVPTECDLTLPGGAVVRTVSWRHTRWLLVEGERWRVRLRIDDDGETFAWVFGESADVVEILAGTIAAWHEPSPADDDSVEVTFCFRGNHGPVRRRRRIDAPRWPAVAGNYARAVRGQFDSLVRTDPLCIEGRLVLLWGPPGTGKTTLLRALAGRWSPWCDTVYVSDPEHLFSDPAYLNAMVLDCHEIDDEVPKRWTLLVLEDCDELIRPDAKNASGQALSRLLNLTDGMVGQGLRVLVCLTTNEELRRLHPAVTRPGRCLAQIEVGRLDRAEARQWLTASAADPMASSTVSIGSDGASLAELFALRRGVPVGSVRRSEHRASVGPYL